MWLDLERKTEKGAKYRLLSGIKETFCKFHERIWNIMNEKDHGTNSEEPSDITQRNKRKSREMMNQNCNKIFLFRENKRCDSLVGVAGETNHVISF